MPPGLGRGTGLAGEVGIESRVGYRGPCRSVLPASYPSRNGGRRGYARLESEGDKNLGGSPWSDGICGRGHYGESVPREGGRTPGPCWR